MKPLDNSSKGSADALAFFMSFAVWVMPLSDLEILFPEQT